MANKKKMASRMRCSVVVLGDSRAGKSALIRRFTEGKFTQVGRMFLCSLIATKVHVIST